MDIQFDKSIINAYSDSLTNNKSRVNMATMKHAIELLEKRISQLIEQCQSLKQENARLKQIISDDQQERAQLLAMHEGATQKVRLALAQLTQLGRLH